MAKVVGIEPTSQGFGDLRITVFPHRHKKIELILERIVRLKLTSLAWKAKAQSLYHTRIKVIYGGSVRYRSSPANG